MFYIWKIAEICWNMNLSPQEIASWKVIPTKPFSEPYSRDFLWSVKKGDTDEVKLKILWNRYFVYVFDNCLQTALHWAAKRNYFKILQALIEKGANVNSLDIGRWTPLYIASKMGHLESVKVLLCAKADPAYKTHSGETA